MAGNGRFELASGSPETGFGGNYPNGSRGNYPGPSLDRSGSFREGGESRMFGSGASTSRVSAAMMGSLPPLSQCLMLEPIMIGDQKYIRSGELRRALGLSVGSASEENSLGTAHLRPLSPVVMEELKRYKESVIDTNNKARGRAKKLDEHLHKLNRYFEVVNTKKQQRNELSHERSGGLNLKMGNHMHRNPSDIGAQRLEDRAKNAVLNKRVRSSVAETRVECQSNGLAMHHLVSVKDRDILKDGNPGSDLVEEKIRRLPAGGEGWDKKMKRKRSLNTALTRPVDSNKELKRPVHHKANESGLQSCDAHGFRSGSINGIRGTNKLDSSSSPASSFGRAAPKHEQEKATLMRDLTAGLNKEKLFAKGNKLNTREDNHIASPSPVTKGKASRAPRSGSVISASSSPNITRVSGAPESWEQPSSVNKIYSVGGANNRKRPLPSGSSSPPMAQWVGQRPQKMSRTRRANLVSPVSNHEEMQMSSEGCSPSEFGSRINSGGLNGSFFRGVANGTQQLKVKLENVSSPARFSESEESGAGENRLKEKVVGSGELEEKVSAAQNSGPPVLIPKKNKSLMKEEITDGVRRQGRSGRGSSSSMASISPVMETLENAATAKPLRSARPGSDKNGSKTGRPLKKVVDRKGLSRRGHVPNSSSPDYTGESDDDREELLAAAKFSHNASYDACSSPFWKNAEPVFGPVRFRDTSYVSQQGKYAEELHESLLHMLGCNNNALDTLVHEEVSVSGTIRSGERGRIELARMVEISSQFQNFDILCGKLDSEIKLNRVTPLYQRVLSALIVEDEIEEFEEDGLGRNASLQYVTNDYQYNAEPRKRDKMDFEYGLTYGAQTQKQCGENRFFSCNGSNMSNRSSVIQSPSQNEELLQGEAMFVHSSNGTLTALSGGDMDGPEFVAVNGFCNSSFDNQYAEMCMDNKLLLELQSIGIYIDRVPDLDDGEEEAVNQEIVKLKKEILKQIGKKKVDLDNVCNAVEQGKESEALELEQVAMDKLVELAYKKLLATRGSIASKWGIPKVSKQVALAFAKRTLARCRAFEHSGKSCFNEPVLRDAIFAAPQGNEAEPSTCDGLGVGSSHSGAEQHDFHRGPLDAFDNYAHQFDQAFAQNGSSLNRGKKKEILLDDVGGNTALRPSTTIASNVLGGAKGKRSERERDKDILSRNPVAKGGRPSSSKGERKSKAKPKQKTSQLSASGNGFVNKLTETTHPVYPSATGTGGFVNNAIGRKREAGLMSPNTLPRDSSKERNESVDFTNLQLPELGSMDELAVGTELGGHQDLASWLNFDEDNLGDHDSVGLAIPMDDISELNMF